MTENNIKGYKEMRNQAKYGLPYIRSKNRFAQMIVDQLPEADTFYDLCSGGGSVAHAAAMSGKYKHIVMVDIDPMTTQYLQKAINGDFDRIIPEWISRERFQAEKDNDPYIRFLWSYGNAGRYYLYNKNLEQEKKIMFETGSGRIEVLERLERCKRFSADIKKSGVTVEILNKSYDDIIIKPGSVIYIDPPYEKTYNIDDMFKWVKTQECTTAFSSFEITNNDFIKIIIGEKERLYLNRVETLKRTHDIKFLDSFGDILTFYDNGFYKAYQNDENMMFLIFQERDNITYIEFLKRLSLKKGI